MASHTFVRLGRYHDGVLSNVRAFQADMDDSEHCRVPYLPEHNLEMLIYAATLGGEVKCFLLTLCAIFHQQVCSKAVTSLRCGLILVWLTKKGCRMLVGNAIVSALSEAPEGERTNTQLDMCMISACRSCTSA